MTRILQSIVLIYLFLCAAEYATAAAKIHVFRPKQAQGGAVVFKVLINDEVVVKLSNGSRATLIAKSEGAMDIKLQASSFTSKTISFGVLNNEEYFIKAGYDDGFGSKLSFVQLTDEEGKEEFNDASNYFKKTEKVINEDSSNPFVDVEFYRQVQQQEEMEEQSMLRNINFDWQSLRKHFVEVDDKNYQLDICVNGNGDDCKITLLQNGKTIQKLENTNLSGINCALQLSEELSLSKGNNNVEVVLESNGQVISSKRVIAYIPKNEKPVGTNRLALVIGNSTYDQVADLENPDNDAVAVSDALKALGFEVMLHLDTDYRSLKRAIGDFGIKLENYDIGLFYYAGHGVQYQSRNYLVPIDANLTNEKDIEYECVDAGSVITKMEIMNTNTNIVILDACRNLPFSSSGTRSLYSKVGLTGIDAPAGTIIAYSTAPGKVAYDGQEENGLYTGELLKYIDRPRLKVEDLFKIVRINVMKKSSNQQIPWESSSLTGDFYFNSNNYKP